jgi:hypothetical protein
VNTTNSSLSSASRPGWQLLGETELRAGSNAHTIGTWLVEQLTPLNLQPEFVKQLWNSAQEVTMRALDSNTSMDFEHVHVSVFAPSELTTHGNIWGFFRIEKIDSTEPNKHHPEHAVEFYLYLERK